MRQVAFLRSINVGGRRVTNAELIAIFEGLGLTDVTAYQAAGNLIFTGEVHDQAVQQGLSGALGYDVPVLLRTGDDVRAIARCNPFSPEEHAASKGKVQVSLLQEAPATAVLDRETDEDRLRLVGRELYWLPIGRTTDSELDLRAIDKQLGLQTRRTQGTIARIAKRFFS